MGNQKSPRADKQNYFTAIDRGLCLFTSLLTKEINSMTSRRTCVFRGFAALALLVAASVAFANESPALRKIMKSLGEHMQTVADGIAREDWELVEKTAPLVADHPRPPLSEKMRIMGFVGTNIAKYKSYDSETHDNAQALGVAARARDGQGTIIAFQQLQTSCYNCHREFRKPFVEHFYGKED